MKTHWIILIAAVLVTLVNWSFLRGDTPHSADMTTLFNPILSLRGAESIWNPYQMGGYPLYAESQAETFYPFRQVLHLLPARFAMSFYILGHLILGAVGVVLLLRAMNLRAVPCLFGALLFAIGPYMYARLMNPSHLFSQSWLPWLMLGFVFLTKSERQKGVFFATLSATMLFLLGVPHTIIYGFIAVLIFVIVQTGSLTSRNRKKFLSTAILVWVLAVGLSAVQLVPSIMLVPETVRSEISAREVLKDALRWVEVFFVLYGSKRPAIRGDAATYPGIVSLIIVLLALCIDGKQLLGKARFWWILLVVSILLALGARGGLYLSFLVIPVFRWLAGPVRALCLFHLAFCVLAGTSFNLILQRKNLVNKRKRLFLLFSLLFVLLPVFLRQCCFFEPRRGFFISLQGNYNSLLPPVLAIVVLAMVFLWMAGRISARIGCIALLALLLLDVSHYRKNQHMYFTGSDYYEIPPGIEKIRDEMMPGERAVGYQPSALYAQDIYNNLLPESLWPDFASLFRIPDLQGFDPLLLERYVHLVEQTVGRRPDFETQRLLIFDHLLHPIVDYLGVRFVAGNPYELRCPGRLFVTSSKAAPVDIPLPELQGRPITGVGIVGFVDGPHDLPKGNVAGRLVGEYENRAVFDLPVRFGHDTLCRTLEPDEQIAARPFPSETWYTETPRGWLQLNSYYAVLPTSEVVPIDKLTLQPGKLPFNFVANAVTVFVQQDGTYKEVFPHPVIPIYKRVQDVTPASLVHETVHTEEMPPSEYWSTPSEWSRVAYVDEPIDLGSASEDLDESNYVRLVAASAMKWVYEVDSSCEALLVTNRFFYPGWRSTVSGKRVPTVRCNGMFRGVVVPSGKSEVVFYFLPTDLLVGACLSFVFLGAFIFLCRQKQGWNSAEISPGA